MEWRSDWMTTPSYLNANDHLRKRALKRKRKKKGSKIKRG